MLYFDESGYTGPDLTNVSQPYFALASVKMTNDEIACLKKDIGYYEWGKELHFKSMYTNPQGRAILAYIIHSGFISGYQNRYGDNLKPPTNVYHRMTA